MSIYTKSRQNKYTKVTNPGNLKLYECPIFSTHNTFFEGNTFIDNTYQEIIKLCTFFPVCIEIDFKPVDLKKTIKQTTKKPRNSSNSTSSVNSNNTSISIRELRELMNKNPTDDYDVFNNEEVQLSDYIITNVSQVGGTSFNNVQDVPECIQCGIGHGPLSKDHTKIKYDDQFEYLNKIIDTYKNINNNKYPLIITFDIEKVLSGRGLKDAMFGPRPRPRSSFNSLYSSNRNNYIQVKKIKETTRCLQNVSKYCEIIYKKFYENKNMVGEDYKNKKLSKCMNKIIVRLKENQYEHISNNLNIPYIMNEGSYGYNYPKKEVVYKKIIRVYPKSFDQKKQKDISKDIVNATINMFENENEKYKNVNMMAFNYHNNNDKDKANLVEKFTDFYNKNNIIVYNTLMGGKPKTKKKKRNSSNKKKSVKKQKK